MNLIPIMALDAPATINKLVVLFLVGFALVVLFLVGRYFCRKPSVPPLVYSIWEGAFVLLGGLLLVAFLLDLAGHPWIKF